MSGRQEVEIVVAVDYNGTIALPRNGIKGIHCIEKPLTDTFAEHLVDEDPGSEPVEVRVGRLQEADIRVFKNEPWSIGRERFSSDFGTLDGIFRYMDAEWEQEQKGTRIQRYFNWLEQEEAVQKLASQKNVSLTIVSATPAEYAERLWYEELTYPMRSVMCPQRQMILRADSNVDQMEAKVVSNAFLAYKLDQPPEQRSKGAERVLYVFDDDPNLVKTVVGLFWKLGVRGISPTPEEEISKFPAMSMPRIVEEALGVKLIRDRIHWGVPLTEVAGDPELLIKWAVDKDCSKSSAAIQDGIIFSARNDPLWNYLLS